MLKHKCLNMWTVRTVVRLHFGLLNPIALQKAKIVYKFGLSVCKRVKLAYIFFIQIPIMAALLARKVSLDIDDN